MKTAFPSLFAFPVLCAFPLLCAALLPAASAQILANPGFEQTYTPVAPTGDTAADAAKITGSTAPGWSDNTGWASAGPAHHGPAWAQPRYRANSGFD